MWKLPVVNLGKMFLFKIWRVIKKVDSKSDETKKFYLKIWRVVFSSIQNLTRNENFNSKLCFQKNTKDVKYVVFTEKKETKLDFWV